MRKILIVAALSILIAGQAAAQVNTVSVLPLDNLSTNPEAAYFAAGLREELLDQLAKIPGLDVSSATSADHADVHVQAFMQGSTEYADGHVRIRLRLVDAMSGQVLWSEVFTRQFTDTFAIQTQIAQAVAEAMQAQLVAGTQ